MRMMFKPGRIKVGAKLRITPTLIGVERSAWRPKKCRVVYVHPLHRFFVVEFRSDTGQTWRESFPFLVVEEEGGGNP